MIALRFPDQTDLASNLRRLMARDGVSFDELVERSGVDARTVSGLLNGRQQPQSRTLHRLAVALGVPADEFFQDGTALRIGTSIAKRTRSSRTSSPSGRTCLMNGPRPISMTYITALVLAAR